MSDKTSKIDNSENLEKISSISLIEEMKKSYLDYAMSVIVSRALPDARDGLKPVHRRILYAMNESGYNYNKSYKKSARIVGEVMGKYHPHGDSAIYDSMVRMCQSFSMRLELVDGQGNFGSLDGDPPAAMRYTEARLAKISERMVNDLEKQTISFQENYDDTTIEPSVLPAQFPNLLVNGAGGIAVGMATSIPPHNLGEVIDGTLALIKNKNIKIKELMKFIPGPDFPTGGVIIGKDIIKQGYKTGRGSFKIRGEIKVENLKNGKDRLVITSIPYQINKSNLNERIAELVRDKKIDGIAELRDESDKDGMRIAIELKKSANSEIILNNLFLHTGMQSSFSINMVALVAGKPKLVSLKEILRAFIEHRVDVVTRRTIYELKKARERAHILEGLTVALSNIDDVIQLIKKSPSSIEAKKKLLSVKWKLGTVKNILDINQVKV